MWRLCIGFGNPLRNCVWPEYHAQTISASTVGAAPALVLTDGRRSGRCLITPAPRDRHISSPLAYEMLVLVLVLVVCAAKMVCLNLHKVIHTGLYDITRRSVLGDSLDWCAQSRNMQADKQPRWGGLI